MNVRGLVSQAMKDLAVLASGEVPTADEAADGLVCFNQLVDALALDRLMLYSMRRTVKTLTSGTASYTIGPSADIPIVNRPDWIDYARLILDLSASTPLEVPLRLLNNEEYASWPAKTEQSSQSSAVWYDHGFTLGLASVFVLPIPSVSTTQLVLYTPSGHIAQVDDLDDEFTAPKGYELAFRKLLALAIKPMFPAAQVGPLLMQQAIDAKEFIRNANARPLKRRSSPGLVCGGGTFDMNTGGYR